MSDTQTSSQQRRSAGAFDIRNIIGLLLVIFGVVLGLAGLFGDAETNKTDGVNANLWAGVALLVGGLIFIGWARLRPIQVPAEVGSVGDDPVRPAPRRKRDA